MPNVKTRGKQTLRPQFIIIGKLDIFPLMCAADKVWITELTLIHKNIRSVRNSHVQVYWSILRKTHYDVTDKYNNVHTEGLDRQYHKYTGSSSGLPLLSN